MTIDAMIMELEHIILDMVVPVQSVKSKKVDRSSPTDIGVATKEDRVGKDETKNSEEQRIADISGQAVHKGAWPKGSWDLIEW